MPEPPPPKRLLTLSSGGWVILLSAFFCLLAAALVLYPVWKTGAHAAVGDGHNPDTYGFDLTNLTIPRDQLLASGYPKDGIRAIPESLVETVSPPEVDLIAQNEHIRFLIPTDQVIGIALGTEARAYPVRILNIHEVVNDSLDGRPIVITWSPLCGSAAVFDRRLDSPSSPPAEFGVSGLLDHSNLLLFDRRADPHRESLWSQLSCRAIAGPAVGASLTLIPFELTTWEQWLREHPTTRIFLGLRTHKAEYTDAQDPINLYLSNDNLRFPVTPLWNHPGIPRKTPIIAESTDGQHWTVRRASSPSSSPPPPYRLYSFIFAWYAQHPNDTDYSALGGGGP